MRKSLLLAAALWLCAQPLAAQQANADGADITAVASQGAAEVNLNAPTTETGAEATVSLVTSYPGSRNYELYGHTMIRLVTADYDVLFNYGIFNFRQSGFLYRFVRGECDYMLAAYPTSYLTQGYESRRIVEQVLRLTPEQTRHIVDYLMWNVRPENATYRYGWAYNNCATRPRDIIEQAIGPSLHYAPASEPDATFRSIMAYYDTNYPWQQFALDLVLGYGLDKPLSHREQMFAPIKLQEAIAGAWYADSLGHKTPLVQATRTLVDGPLTGNILPPTPWPLRPLTVFTLVLLAAIAVTIAEQKSAGKAPSASSSKRKATRAGQVFDTVLFAAIGLAGTLTAFLFFFSTHYGTSTTIHVLWANPLALTAAIGPWIKKAGKITLAYHIYNVLALTALAAGWHFLPQTACLAMLPLTATAWLRSAAHILRQKQRKSRA